MTKPIEVSHKNYEKLWDKLKEDYPPSVILIKRKRIEKLGFTPRDYREYDKANGLYKTSCMMLDFYSEKKRTFFIMKYGEFLND